MTRFAALPPEAHAQLRTLDPAADRPETAPEMLAELSSRIVAGQGLVSDLGSETDRIERIDWSPVPLQVGPPRKARRLRILVSLAAALIFVVLAGVALSGRLGSAGPVVAAPPSTGSSSVPALQPLGKGESAARVVAVTLDGSQLRLSWDNGQCIPEGLTKQLVRVESQPTTQGLEVLVVVKDNPVGQPKDGMCRGVGVTSRVTLTLAAPLEPAVVLDQATTPATLIAVPKTPEIVPPAARAYPPIPDSLLAELEASGTEVAPVEIDSDGIPSAITKASNNLEYVTYAQVTVNGYTKAGKPIIKDRMVWVLVSQEGIQMATSPGPDPSATPRNPVTQVARTATLVDATTEKFLFAETIR